MVRHSTFSHQRTYLHPLLLLLLLCASSSQADPTCSYDVERASLPSLLRKVKPAVVTIHVYNDEGEVISQGSGWFITERVVVSTRHTFWKESVQGAAFAKVTTNAIYGSTPGTTQQYLVKAVLADETALDLILIEVVPIVPRAASHSQTAPPQPVLPVSFAHLQEGAPIFVVSTPLGLPGVVSEGIISAIHNELDLQISAPVSTGSSGAPVLDYRGHVVAIVSGHLSEGQNLNFAVSTRALAMLIAKLRASLKLPNTPQLPERTQPEKERVAMNVKDNQESVAVWDDQQTKELFTVDDIEQERLRPVCYPTLVEWAASQRKAGMHRWWQGWRLFLEALWPSNRTRLAQRNEQEPQEVDDDETETASGTSHNGSLSVSTPERVVSFERFLDDLAVVRSTLGQVQPISAPMPASASPKATRIEESASDEDLD